MTLPFRKQYSNFKIFFIKWVHFRFEKFVVMTSSFLHSNNVAENGAVAGIEIRYFYVYKIYLRCIPQFTKVGFQLFSFNFRQLVVFIL